MENKNNVIIAILILIIIVLSCIIGFMLLPPSNAQKDSKLVITSNETLYNGDNLTVKLTDMNGTGIADQNVNVTIIDSDGSKNYKFIRTDSKGIANLEIDKSAGNYTVNCTFGGNENYTGNSTSQELTVEEIIEQPVVEQTTTQQSTSSSSRSSSSRSDYRPAVDSEGITREEADYYGWKYTSQHGGHYIGPHDHWDENAGVYHD